MPHSRSTIYLCVLLLLLAGFLLIYPASSASAMGNCWYLYHALASVSFCIYGWLYRTQGNKLMARLNEALEMVPSESKKTQYRDTFVSIQHTHTHRRISDADAQCLTTYGCLA